MNEFGISSGFQNSRCKRIAISLFGLGNVSHHVTRNRVPQSKLFKIQFDELSILLCNGTISKTNGRARVHSKELSLIGVGNGNLGCLECMLNGSPRRAGRKDSCEKVKVGSCPNERRRSVKVR